MRRGAAASTQVVECSISVDGALGARLGRSATSEGISPAALASAAAAVVLADHAGQRELAVALGAPGAAARSRSIDLAAAPSLAALARALDSPPGGSPGACELAVFAGGWQEPPGGAPCEGPFAVALDLDLGAATLRARGRAPEFGAWRLERILEQVAAALSCAAERPQTGLEALRQVSDADRALLAGWENGPPAEADTTIHALVEELAVRQPEAPALLWRGEAGQRRTITYRELVAQARRQAGALRRRGVKPHDVVGISIARSAESIVSLLAILEAGAAYLPLDPAYPRERLSFMLRDTGVALVVADAAGSRALSGSPGAEVVRLEALAADAGPAPEQAAAAGPEDLAYVCYTSGSTGQPKGAEIPHRAVVRLARGLPFAELGPGRVVLHAAPLAFDASTFEIWAALAAGAAVALHDEPVPTARGLSASVGLLRADTAWLTSALFNAVVDEDPASLRGLRMLLTGGEALSADHVRRAQAALPGTTLVNGYGPTEATTFTCCHVIPAPFDPGARAVPIGKPIGGTCVRILDERLGLTPVGAVGELCVGGPGLARGYRGQAALTAERFVADPFGAAGERLYRTGDLVRWTEGGVVEFLGRADGQVKIRGFRIEVGEIESALRRHPAVRTCAVIAREDPGRPRRLAAYLVPSGPERPPLSELRGHLAELLPEHMIPAAAVWLDALPVNANGKLDRRALPAPPADREGLAGEYQPPRGELEKGLVAVFEAILGREPVGVQDGFFELGGDSLLATRAVARVRAQLGIDLPVVRLFEHPTVAGLAEAVEGERRQAVAPARRARRGAGDGDVAVIGFAGRFPGAAGVEALWQNLCAGLESITTFADGDLDPAVPASLRTDPAYVKARGIVDGWDRFDAAFFGISPKEASMMDPQQRLLLETTWEALERAGHVPATFPGEIGIFAGQYFDFYYDRILSTRRELVEAFGDLNTAIGNDKHFIATRVAHRLGLSGPALSIHTACSTSLVAACQAVQSLRAGESDLALAGGVSITVPVRSGYLYQEGSMLSPDGHTRPFDALASGTTFGDGVAVVVLRRLEDALADGDLVYAIIRGVAVNNDGANRASFTAPGIEGQSKVISRALADAGVEARSISYVETHGTATPLGDPIEVEALTRAYRRTTADRGFCAIGSVKSNVGHLVTAAGATGLIKTALSLHHRLLPPTLHYRAPNPRLDLASSPFFVQDRLAPWTSEGAPRRAGVSSFGVGGTNAHVVLEEAPAATPSDPAPPGQLLLLSARTPEALESATLRLREALAADPPATNLADVAFTLQTGRQAFAHRRFLVARDPADAVAGLDPAARRLVTGKTERRDPPVAFLFPGQGAQHVDMGRTLYRTEPVFRSAIDRCAEALKGELERDLREVIYPTGDAQAAAALLQQTAYTQPALFAIELALAELWSAWGVHPRVTAGHSVGEFVSAALAGVLSTDDAARLVAARGRLMQEMPPGSMLSVGLPAEEAQERIRSRPELAVAAHNAPGLCVVAGPPEPVRSLQRELEEAGVAARLLVTSHAFHSPMMDPVVERFAALVRSVHLAAPRTPFVSTVTGTWITEQQATDPGYWAGHLRATVRFADAARTLLSDPETVLLEVGPRAMLTAMVRRQLPAPGARVVIPSLGDSSADGADRMALLAAAGQLWSAGAGLDFAALHGGGRRRRVVLPTYPFQRKRHWIDPAAPALAAAPPPEPSRPAPAIPPPTRPVEAPMPENSPTAAPSARLDAVRAVFEEVTGLELAGADPGAAFVDLGLDSLSLTQASLQLQRRFGVKVTFRQLMESLSSLGAVAAHLDAQLPAAEAPARPAPAPAPSPAQPQAAAAPGPVLAALPAALVAAAPGAGSTLQQVIDQQLRLMAQQLALLGAAPAQAPAEAAAAAPRAGADPRPAEVPAAPPAAATSPDAAAARPASAEEPAGLQKYDVKKAFGAIARIHAGHQELSPVQRARLEALIRRYATRTKGSKELTQRNRAHLADPRVVTGFKPALKELTYQVVIQRSSGSRLWDVDGNEYVDALCGFGSCFFGWQPAFVTEAVKKQLDTGHEIGPMTPLAGEVARLVCEMTGFDRAGFCNTGSEAVLGCMRAARTVTGRSLIALFAGSYHGIFDEVIVRGARGHRGIPAAPGILPGTAENVLVLEYGAPESLEILRARASELAAVLVEPIQSRRPDLQPREFLHEVRALTTQSGAALIFDEVVNGFRTGPGGAQEFYGVRADLASYGKVVGGGFPIGIIAGKKEWADALDGGFWQFGDDSTPTAGVTYFAGTFCRHPLALAAARAVLLHLKEKGPALQQEVAEKATRIATELNGFFDAARVPLHVKHFSSLWKPVFTEDVPFGELLFVLLRERGVHILDGFPCFMTTAHTAADVDHIVRAFRESVVEMQESGFLPAPPPAASIADASQPPVPGARLGRDPSGRPTWYVPNPDAPGKFLPVEVKR